MTPAEAILTGILADIPPAYREHVVAVLAFEAAGGSNLRASSLLGVSARTVSRRRRAFRQWAQKHLPPLLR